MEDTARYDFFSGSDESLEEARARYRQTMARSKFVLCPRGAGASSYRLYETLAGGRVPVIISDEWVAPNGVDWQSCAVRVREGEVAGLPTRLASLEEAWPRMSAAAAAAYDGFFAPDVWFHRAVEHCRDLQAAGASGLSREWTTGAFWADALRHSGGSWRRRGSSR